jgi:hypothetical protein
MYRYTFSNFKKSKDNNCFKPLGAIKLKIQTV